VSIQEYYLPKSLDKATNLLAGEAQGSLILAGGTLAMPLINDGISTPDLVLGLKQAGLNYIIERGDEVLIGATTTLSQMTVQKVIPMLAEAASSIGGWAIRNMATVGGNLFAPPPGADLAAALLALDTELTLVGQLGERKIPLKDFFTGFMTNVLQPGEIIKEFRMKLPKGKTAFTKYGRRQKNTPSIVTVALNVEFDDGEITKARIALNAVGPHPIRAEKAEQYLVGKSLAGDVITKTADLATSECEPFTDPIASEWYRRKMVPVILGRTLEEIAS
jgi:xanthine dehydrogenase small subunit